MITMPYFALTPELTQDYDERTSLTMYRMAFSITGSLTAFIVPLLIIGEMHPANAPRVIMMGLIFGAICAIPPLLAFFGTVERPEILHADPSPASANPSRQSGKIAHSCSPPEFSSSPGRLLTSSRFSCCTS